MIVTQEGAFDTAVQGVDAIEHTASPFHFNADDPHGTFFISQLHNIYLVKYLRINRASRKGDHRNS